MRLKFDLVEDAVVEHVWRGPVKVHLQPWHQLALVVEQFHPLAPVASLELQFYEVRGESGSANVEARNIVIFSRLHLLFCADLEQLRRETIDRSVVLGNFLVVPARTDELAAEDVAGGYEIENSIHDF